MILASGGVLWGPLGAFLGRLGGLMGPLGALLGPYWAVLGRLGAILGHLEALLESQEAQEVEIIDFLSVLVGFRAPGGGPLWSVHVARLQGGLGGET